MVTQIVLFSFSTSFTLNLTYAVKEKCSLYEGRERETYSNKKVFINKFLAILCYYIFINIPPCLKGSDVADLCYILFVLKNLGEIKKKFTVVDIIVVIVLLSESITQSQMLY